MKRTLLYTAVVMFLSAPLSAQVKIGYNAASGVNTAAILELSNDVSATAAAGDWKALLLSYVDFANTTAFTDNTIWGIAGAATEGLVVYNTGNRITNGFAGTGVYVWRNAAWIPVGSR